MAKTISILGALDRVANRPLLITPARGREVLTYLMQRRGMGVTVLAMEDDEGAPATIAADMRYQRKQGKAYHYADGIAIIPVEDSLIHKSGNIDPDCGTTGYDGIARKMREASADPEVRGILLDFNSPGGEVDGCADLGQLINLVKITKPVWGLVDSNCYSAAYWLGSQCDRLYMTENSGLGSIGVLMQHVDWSENLKAEGIAVTLIHAGAHKVDGNPYAPLPETVRAGFEAECEDLRLKFAEAVAEGRGLDVETVLATEARCLTAEEAIAGGFADGVVASFDIVRIFLDDINGAAPAPRSAAPGAQAAAPQLSQENEMNEKNGAAPEQVAAIAEALAADRTRAAAILDHEAAKGRRKLARKLAFSGMAVDEAVAILEAAPKAAKKSGSPLADAMSRVGDVNVDHDAAKSGKAGAKPINSAGIYTARAKSMGQSA